MIAKGIAKPIVKDDVEFLQVDKIVTKVRINNAQAELVDSQSPGAGKHLNV